MSENVELGFWDTHDYFGWKKTRFLKPCVLHGFVHLGKILRHLRWMQEQTSVLYPEDTRSTPIRSEAVLSRALPAHSGQGREKTHSSRGLVAREIKTAL